MEGNKGKSFEFRSQGPHLASLRVGGPCGLVGGASIGINLSWAWLSHTQSLYSESGVLGEDGQDVSGTGRPVGSLCPRWQCLLQAPVSVQDSLKEKPCGVWSAHLWALPLQRTLSNIVSLVAFLLSKSALCLPVSSVNYVLLSSSASPLQMVFRASHSS